MPLAIRSDKDRAPLLSESRSLLFTLLALATFVTACRTEPERDYAARLGDDVLTREEVSAALAGLPPGLDSADAREQLVERWVTNALLAREAERRGLHREEDVQRLLRESEQSVLTTALINRLYEEADEEPGQAEIRSYFEAHSEQLQLREPFIRIRYLSTLNRQDAASARGDLQQAIQRGIADSLWPGIIQAYAGDAAVARELSQNYLPESRVMRSLPPLRDALSSLRAGQLSPVIEGDGTFHIIQVVDRVPAGTLPRLEWIEDDLRQRIKIRNRKQIYSRSVQRLRNEALAREELEIKID